MSRTLNARAPDSPAMPLHGWERRGFLLFAGFLAVSIPLAVWFAAPLWTDAPGAPQEATPTNTIAVAVGVALFIALAAGMATFVLWAVKHGKERIIQGLVLGAVAIVLVVPFYRGVAWLQGPLGEAGAWAVGFLVSAGLVVAWSRHRTWWADDIVTLLLAATLAALVGSVLGVLGVVPLLAAMAAFDAWAVLRTGKMVRLAHAARRMRLPTLIASGPGQRARKTRRRRGDTSDAAKATTDDAGPAASPRPAPGGILLFGVGDLVFPAALVVAAADPARGWGAWPAAGAAAGTLVGYAVLVRMTASRHALPGLPVLCSGALTGFLAGLGAATGGLRFWT